MSALPLMALLAAALGRAESPTPKPIEHTVELPVPLQAAWERWTTVAGLQTFFAREMHIDLRVGGNFDALFFPANEPGLRGAEGLRIMAVEPPHRLAFDWSAPPRWPEQRVQRTMVQVRLAATDRGGTLVRLTHLGWGDGDEWQQVRDYFDAAWLKILARLEHSVEVGPIDWDSPPPELMHSD